MSILFWHLAKRLGWGIADHFLERHDALKRGLRKLDSGEDLSHVEAVEVAKGSRPLGFGKSLIAVLILAPLVAPWLGALGFESLAEAGKQVASLLTDESGWLDYGHVALGIAWAAFGMRRP